MNALTQPLTQPSCRTYFKGSGLGDTAQQRLNTLLGFDLNDADSDLITIDNQIAFFLDEAIGRLTNKGQWDQAWTAYGLHSKHNKPDPTPALTEARHSSNWDPKHLIGRLKYIRPNEMDKILQIRQEWIDKIRINTNQRGLLTKQAKADLAARCKELITLDASREILHSLDRLSTAYANHNQHLLDTRLKLNDAIHSKALSTIHTNLNKLHAADTQNQQHLAATRRNLDKAIQARRDAERKALEPIYLPILKQIQQRQAADALIKQKRRELAQKIGEHAARARYLAKHQLDMTWDEALALTHKEGESDDDLCLRIQSALEKITANDIKYRHKNIDAIIKQHLAIWKARRRWEAENGKINWR